MMTVNVGAGQVARTGGRRGTPRAARRRDSSHVLAGIRVRGLDGMPGPAMRAPVPPSRRSQAPGPTGDGASDEEIRRRLPVPRPYYAFNVQRVDLAVA